MTPDYKKPLGVSLNRFAASKALDQIAASGCALPCSVVSVKGGIVQVKFEIQDPVLTLPNVTMPVANSIYCRDPLQPGDKGMTVPSEAYLGGMSGLGGGVASLTRPGNLSALVFHPIGNSAWPAPIDPMKQQTQGPDGVVIRDMAGRVSVTADGPSGSLVIKCGGTTYTFSAAGLVTSTLGGGAALSFGAAGINVQNGGVQVNNGGVQVQGGDVNADSITLKQHRHIGRGNGAETDAPNE